MFDKARRILAPVALLVAMVMFAGPAVAQEFTFKAHTFIGAMAPTIARLMKPWAEKVEQESNGRIKINIYPSMQLGGSPPQLIDQVRDGVVDIVWTLPGYTPGRFVKTEVFELPFIHTTPVATNMALQDFAERHGDEFSDIHVILLHVHAGSVFHSYDPIRTVDDIEGMKIRTPSRTGGWFLEALGATPIGAPVPKVPELLSKRVVDAVLIPYEITMALKTHEMVDYHTSLDDPKYPRPNTSVFLFAMNKDSYNSLPPDLKQVIDDNSGRNIARWAGETWVDVEVPGEKAAAASGELIKLPPAEVAKMRRLVEKPVHDRWIADVKAKGIDGAALIEEAKMLLDKYTE